MSSELNITILDQSPTFIYSPDREGSSSSEWVSAWTGSADSTYDATHTQPNIAQGTSSHFTTLAGATVEIDFFGVAVTIYGQGTAGAYTTTLDGASPVSGKGGSMLATYGGLNDAKHTITLKATQSQTLSLTHADITIRSDVAPSSVSNTTQTAVTAVGTTSTTNSFFSTTGAGFSNQHADQGYTRLDSNSPGAAISFTCSNTSALYMYGTTNWNHQTFSLELDPPAGASQGARIFNGTSKWFVLDNLLFWEAGLDPTQTYQVKLTNLIDGSYSDLHSVVMMHLPPNTEASASGTTPKSTSTSSSSAPVGTPAPKSSIAKTVGIAVGVVAILGLVVLCAFLAWSRRRKRRRNNARLPIDGAVTPFADASHHKHPSMSGSGTETPMSLSQLQPPIGFRDYPPSTYATNSDYANSAYGAPNNHSIYGGTMDAYGGMQTAPNSVHELGNVRGTHYSELGSEDYNPYAVGQPFAAGAATSVVGGSSSRPQSAARDSGAGPARRPEKGPIPSDTASTRAVRQEVDAGRVPDAHEEEETLPPNYDPTWAS